VFAVCSAAVHASPDLRVPPCPAPTGAQQREQGVESGDSGSDASSSEEDSSSEDENPDAAAAARAAQSARRGKKEAR